MKLPMIISIALNFMMYLPVSANATELFADKPYKLPKSQKIECLDATVVVIFQKLENGGHDYSIVRVDKDEYGKVTKTSLLNDQFSDFDFAKYDFSKFKLNCVSNAPAISVPGKSKTSDDLHLIMTKDNRLIDGFDLTGHGQSDEKD